MKTQRFDDFFSRLIPAIDAFLIPFIYFSGKILKKVRKIGVNKFPLCKKTLLKIGIFPIIDHYYEPLFDVRTLCRPLSDNRVLPGIDWNEAEQLHILSQFSFNDELIGLPTSKLTNTEFYINNGAFLSGDAEYWYNLIRLKKPKNIIEIGSGYSTLMAIKAIAKNSEIDATYRCNLVCIEPYEMPWLENLNISVIRERVETISVDFFLQLQHGDILFIDSSHVIRPQGDVLFEYLELLPSLNNGVIVHIHDIFSPRDYLQQWIEDEVKLWNEQYLLEAFLTNNPKWKIIGALNFLHHNHYESLSEKSPYLHKNREPGSFYIQKVV